MATRSRSCSLCLHYPTFRCSLSYKYTTAYYLSSRTLTLFMLRKGLGSSDLEPTQKTDTRRGYLLGLQTLLIPHSSPSLNVLFTRCLLVVPKVAIIIERLEPHVSVEWKPLPLPSLPLESLLRAFLQTRSPTHPCESQKLQTRWECPH